MSEIGEAITELHRKLFNELVERAETLEGERSERNLAAVVEFLRSDLSGHMRGEDSDLYPAVEPLMKAHGKPTAGLELDHGFIEEYIRRIDRTAQEIKAAGADQQVHLWQHLHHLFIQMEAILELHLGKEEALLIPLFEQYLPEDKQRLVLEGMRKAHDL